jgi:cyclophilin family peptidyl-prolyl cis-trans isomerase
MSRFARFALVLLSLGFAATAAAQAPAADAKPADAKPRVSLKTNMGEIVVELDPAKAPKSVENFLQYVKEKHYDGTIFHRVIPTFMIQGGGYTSNGQAKGTRPPVTNEADNGLPNLRGTIAMARTGDPHSATAQFFINVVDNPFLNHVSKENGSTWGYAVFGKVVSGMEVVDAIKNVQTAPQGMFPNAPTSPVVVNTATLVE